MFLGTSNTHLSIADERIVYHNCAFRLNGSAYGRHAASGFGYIIDFPADHPFRRVYDSVSIERAGNLKGPWPSTCSTGPAGEMGADTLRQWTGVAGFRLIAASRRTHVFLKSMFPEAPLAPPHVAGSRQIRRPRPPGSNVLCA